MKLKMTTLKLVDLFCGTGGFSYALSEIATTVFANDKIRESKFIYQKNAFSYRGSIMI
jgi:site-specific DNA-cytosine methylase